MPILSDGTRLPYPGDQSRKETLKKRSQRAEADKRQQAQPRPPREISPPGRPTPSRGLADRRMTEEFRPVPRPRTPQIPSGDMREFYGGGQMSDILGMLQSGMLEGPMGGLQEPVNQFLDTPLRDMGQYMPAAQLRAIMQMLMSGGGQGDMRGMGL